jgi:hypothetical protein
MSRALHQGPRICHAFAQPLKVQEVPLALWSSKAVLDLDLIFAMPSRQQYRLTVVELVRV